MLKQGQYPYPEDKIFYAIHKEGSVPVVGLRLMKSNCQGIYVAPDLDYVNSYIGALVPGENPSLTFYYTLKDLKEIKKIMSSKEYSKIKNITNSIFSVRKHLWCYVLPENIRMVSFILASSVEEVSKYINKKKKTNYKIIFDSKDLDDIIEIMELIKHGKSEDYNFIVE